jgi:dipeptidyl aminopeptidase/acylaminoacyl peptidase
MQGPDGGVFCRVQAIVPMYGVHDLTIFAQEKNAYDMMTDRQRDLCVKASPVTYASKDDPPVLILHGTGDTNVPVRQSDLLHAALKKVGVSTKLVVVEGAPHSFSLQPTQRDLRPLVIEFFDKYLKP